MSQVRGGAMSIFTMREYGPFQGSIGRKKQKSVPNCRANRSAASLYTPLQKNITFSTAVFFEAHIEYVCFYVTHSTLTLYVGTVLLVV